MTKFKIGSKIISNNNKTYFIADIAANHDGDINKAKDLIYLCAEAGANAAKFQHFTAETIVSDYGFKSLGDKFSHQKNWRKSVYEVYKKASINLEWTEELNKTCRKVGIDFFSSPYSIEMVDHLFPYVPAYKIGSGDITWLEIISYISKKKKPVIIASGASTFAEVKSAIKIIQKYNKKIVLMQCNTNYTASRDNFKFINLNVLKQYKKKFPNILLGLSDHTPGHSTVLGAIALGARVIEKHFTDNNNRVGPDHKFSMNPKTWKQMVEASRELEESLGDGKKKIEKNELETIILQRRAIRSKKLIKKGQIISMNNLIFLRPCPLDALPLKNYRKILGTKAKRNIHFGDFFKKSDCE